MCKRIHADLQDQLKFIDFLAVSTRECVILGGDLGNENGNKKAIKY
jgi:hypothetical protein